MMIDDDDEFFTMYNVLWVSYRQLKERLFDFEVALVLILCHCCCYNSDDGM